MARVLHIPLRTLSGNTRKQESHLLCHLPAQTQTPGGGRSGHICSLTRHWSLTKQHLGQAASHPTHSCLLGGSRPATGLAQVSQLLPCSPRAAPYRERGDEAIPKVAHGFGGRKLFLFLLLSYEARGSRHQNACRSCSTEENALCLPCLLGFGSQDCQNQGGDVSEEE